jgi:MFS family permease
MLAVGILISTGLIQYWHLLLAAFFNGTLASFAFPTSQSLVPELVPRNKLFNAIAMNTAAFNVSRVAGPAISGMLIGFGGTASAYFVAVGFYLVATFLICLLPLSQKVAVKVGRSIKKS